MVVFSSTVGLSGGCCQFNSRFVRRLLSVQQCVCQAVVVSLTVDLSDGCCQFNSRYVRRLLSV